MSKLLVKPNAKPLFEGVTLIHDIQKENSSLSYVAFRMIDIKQGAVYHEEVTGKEVCVVAVTGKITVRTNSDVFQEIGTRESVFEKVPTDSVYAGNGERIEIVGVSDVARVALCYAPTEKSLPTRLIPASENTVEDRGKYQNKRHVHNILPDDSPIADSVLVVEVYTEGGNFSSYPPHKHDQDNLPNESFLEESYYHEMNPSQGFVFQRVYTDDRSIDETMAVLNRDVVLVPAGYHPVGVPDGYTSYYLNVMAGPTRIWKFHNDPAHAWILDRE
ncbi:5-deoxy-glucuronate isomerase [Listeria fleischmannii]|uniref:5-deoxy-glucuronate isomerase n=1 Tax=Listeria fleischmannii TaxID=1069827 RepID=UPI000254F0B5|nr:5-deoxy-glucuronate isomerase [Listeria fleischmannii]EIA19805.1 5-deoxy-D-glucuronic acid isomerase [Listeria fleischmannii subsp. coloradonensis]STY34767.1 5-deoxy-glucuronate isomerase [Listeria fleischmannii subsp. coloradonensis]